MTANLVDRCTHLRAAIFLYVELAAGSPNDTSTSETCRKHLDPTQASVYQERVASMAERLEGLDAHAIPVRKRGDDAVVSLGAALAGIDQRLEDVRRSDAERREQEVRTVSKPATGLL